MVSSADQALVKKELEQHRKVVMRDREVDHWLQSMSKVACGIAPGVPQQSLLSICIDAMDAAKFRCPRNVSASKEFQGLWRPEIHLLGAVSPVCEHYILCDADLKKDASMQVTVLSSALDITHRKLAARGRDMPTELRVHTDNATAEGKNQTMLKFAARLICKGHFDRVSLTQFRVGHSHGLNDQRFSECREVLSASPVLEEPSAYQEVLQKGLAAREKRDLDVQLLHATADWKRFFETLEVNVSGHTQTHQKKVAGQDAVHCFLLTTRGALEEDDVGNLQEFPGSVERHDRDIVMICSMYLSSEVPSQEPFVFVPHVFFAGLPERPTALAPRNELTARQQREFQKTAEAIAAPPWNMNAGCSYLLKFLQDNKDNQSDDWQPPPMDWVTLPTRAVAQGAPAQFPTLHESDLSFAHAEPSKVSVTAKRSRVGVGRLAARLQEEWRPPAATLGNGTADVTPLEPQLPAPADALSTEEWELPAPTLGNATAGAPPAMYGRDGAPPNAVYEPVPPARRGRPPKDPNAKPKASQRAKAKAKATAKAKAGGACPKAKAKERAKAKAKAKSAAAKSAAAPAHRRRRAALPQPADVEHPSCGKCRNKGCAVCRRKAGLVLNADRTAWVYQGAA